MLTADCCWGQVWADGWCWKRSSSQVFSKKSTRRTSVSLPTQRPHRLAYPRPPPVPPTALLTPPPPRLTLLCLFPPTGIQDEYTFCQYTPKAEAQAALADHWATWITEDDIKEIAAAGLNHVRIPIGFWALDVSGGEPYIQGSMYYLRLAVAWAAEHGLHVLIDLREWGWVGAGLCPLGSRANATRLPRVDGAPGKLDFYSLQSPNPLVFSSHHSFPLHHRPRPGPRQPGKHSAPSHPPPRHPFTLTHFAPPLSRDSRPKNAYDNSGRRGQLRWHLHESNVRRTENVLLALATEFTQAKYRNVVTAITPLNEPAGYRHGVTEVAVRYYEDAYKLVRSVGETDPMFLYHDAFMVSRVEGISDEVECRRLTWFAVGVMDAACDVLERVPAGCSQRGPRHPHLHVSSSVLPATSATHELIPLLH